MVPCRLGGIRPRDVGPSWRPSGLGWFMRRAASHAYPNRISYRSGRRVRLVGLFISEFCQSVTALTPGSVNWRTLNCGLRMDCKVSPAALRLAADSESFVCENLACAITILN